MQLGTRALGLPHECLAKSTMASLGSGSFSGPAPERAWRGPRTAGAATARRARRGGAVTNLAPQRPRGSRTNRMSRLSGPRRCSRFAINTIRSFSVAIARFSGMRTRDSKTLWMMGDPPRAALLNAYLRDSNLATMSVQNSLRDSLLYTITATGATSIPKKVVYG